jgi:GNAT superfamily N-acetyltransferase
VKYETNIADFTIRTATQSDVALILSFVRQLAEYERLGDQVVATEESLRATLFGDRPYAECIIGDADDEAVGFALYFHNYSTFLARPGIYLEDLFVKPERRGRGFGRELLRCVARIAEARGCARFEWAVLNWNEPAIGFYQRLQAVPMHEWTVYRITGDALRQLAE